MNLPLTNKRKNKNKNKNNKPLSTLIHEGIMKDKLKSRVVKYFDTYTSGNVSNNPLFLSLVTIPQGVAQNQRVTDTIWCVKLEYRALYVQDNLDVYNTIRSFCFIWKENDNSVLPATALLFDPAGFSSWNTQTPLNFDNRKNYRIVGKDYFDGIVGSATSYTNKTLITRHTVLQLNNLRVDYVEGNTYGTNKLYFTHLSSSGATPFPLTSIQFRLWYYDE